MSSSLATGTVESASLSLTPCAVRRYLHLSRGTTLLIVGVDGRVPRLVVFPPPFLDNTALGVVRVGPAVYRSIRIVRLSVDDLAVWTEGDDGGAGPRLPHLVIFVPLRQLVSTRSDRTVHVQSRYFRPRSPILPSSTNERTLA